MINQNKNLKGAILVELLFVMAVLIVTIVSLLSIMNLSMKTSGEARWSLQANLLAGEAMEAVRNIRDKTEWGTDGLGTLINGTAYHLTQSGTPLIWSLDLGNANIDNFTQSIVFADALRDVNKNIALAGVVDVNTKIITVTISWQSGTANKEINVSSILTNL